MRRFGVYWIAPKEQEVESEQPLRTMAYLAGKPKEDKSMPEKADKLEGRQARRYVGSCGLQVLYAW